MLDCLTFVVCVALDDERDIINSRAVFDFGERLEESLYVESLLSERFTSEGYFRSDDEMAAITSLATASRVGQD